MHTWFDSRIMWLNAIIDRIKGVEDECSCTSSRKCLNCLFPR